MKKTITIFLLIACCFSAFANGSKDKLKYEVIQTENNVKVLVPTSTSGSTTTTKEKNMGILQKTANIIAYILNKLTVRFSLALSPFPSVTTRFYRFIDSKADYDVIPMTEYDSSIKELDTRSDLLINGAAFNYDNISSQILSQYVDEPEIQGKRWGLVFWLVTAFTILEMLYVILIPQTDQNGEGADLRTIIIKFLKSFILILLLAAMPYLLEVTRIGFMKIVGLFAKEEDTAFSMVTMPGYFMTKMGELMDFSDPASITGESLNFLSSKSIGISKIGKLIVELIYIVFDFYMLLLCVRVGVQIMVKIVEVYILLTLCMITMPFSIFTPLKTVGEKSPMSLVSNTIECFVIAIMLAIVLPISNSIIKPVLSSLTEYHNPQIWEIVYASSEDAVNYFSPEGDVNLQIAIDDQCIAARIAGITPNDFEISFEGVINALFLKYPCVYYVNEKDGNMESSSSKAGQYMKKIYLSNSPAASKQAINLETDQIPDAIQLKTDSPESADILYKKFYIELQQVFHETLKDVAVYNNGINDASVEFQQKMVTLLTKNSATAPGLRGYFVDKFAENFAKNGDYVFIKQEPKVPIEERNTFIVEHLIICFLAIYIPIHFVKQSAPITNSILSGGTSQSSVSEEMGRGMMKAHHVMHTSTMIFGNAMRGLTRGLQTLFGTKDNKRNEAPSNAASPTSEAKSMANDASSDQSS